MINVNQTLATPWPHQLFLTDVFWHGRARGSFPEWAVTDCKSFFPKFSNDLVISPEIVYQHKPHFDNYKDTTLILVGGGPSSKGDWENNDYDYIWSMNHFYLSEKLKNKKVDLAMIMGEPDVTSNEFVAYAKEHKPYLGFEVDPKWSRYQFDDYENYFCMHSRFYGRIGVGIRMLILGASLGFSKVLFTGLDGPEPIVQGDHAFQPGKKTLPACFNNMSLENMCIEFKKQYDCAWDIIKTINTKTQFINIGGGSLYHEKC